MQSTNIKCEVVNSVPEVAELEASYLANWDLINQTIFHPFVNAVKFNKFRGSIKVSITIKPGSQRSSPPYFVCEIYDTGMGIAPDQVKDLFTTFKEEKHQELVDQDD